MAVLFTSIFYGFTTPNEKDKTEIRKGIDFYNGDYHEALEKAKEEKNWFLSIFMPIGAACVKR